LSEGDVVEILRTRFGVRCARVEAVGAESAAVFRVNGGDGGDLAVKVFWADTPSSGGVRWQQEVVDRLAEAGLPVARPLRTAEGELTVACRVGDRTALVQASQWLTGTPLERAPITGDLLNEIGRTAARLHRFLQHETAPPDLIEHTWQITRSRTTIESALTRVSSLTEQGRLPSSPSEQARLHRAAAAVFTLLEEDVWPRLGRLPTAVVHHDLHDSNLLVGPESAPTTVTGILDFGDMVHSLRISEPVIAGAYAARHCADPALALNEVVSGWGKSVPVTSDESAVIRPLAAARLIANAAVWMSRLDTSRGAYADSRRRGSLETAEKLLEAV
jgi:Ser/Thr protein kinase RdoA (MazF antagonist)